MTLPIDIAISITFSVSVKGLKSPCQSILKAAIKRYSSVHETISNVNFLRSLSVEHSQPKDLN